VKERNQGDDQIQGSIRKGRTTRFGTTSDLGQSVRDHDKGHDVQRCVSSVGRSSAFFEEANERFAYPVQVPASSLVQVVMI
jgi:hypothetical protein